MYKQFRTLHFRDQLIAIFTASDLSEFGLFADIALAGKVLGALELAGFFQKDAIDSIRDGSFIHWKSYLFEVAASAVLEQDCEFWTDRMFSFSSVVHALELLCVLYKGEVVESGDNAPDI